MNELLSKIKLPERKPLDLPRIKELDLRQPKRETPVFELQKHLLKVLK